MAVVVEQTIPFPSSALDLENPTRWNKLLPLIRPSAKLVKTPKGQDVLIDTSLLNNPYVRIVAIGNVGNFSSKLLSDGHITAIVTEKKDSGSLEPQDVVSAIQGIGPGVVIVRLGKLNAVHSISDSIVEVSLKGDLEVDHVLHLLGNVGRETRSSLKQTTELLEIFTKSASSAHSTFHTEKAEAIPAILHVDGHAGFEKAKHAVERDLKHVLKSHEVTAQKDPLTYSVHYSDVNGLSRLENYILGLEIAIYFDLQNLPYSLSTSTLLQHDSLARGFAISICPVPSTILLPQLRPQNSLADQLSTFSHITTTPSISSSSLTTSDAQVRKRIQAACSALIAEEPTITRYDEIVGDGDCGYTLRDGAKQVLSFIADKDLSGHALPATISDLVHDLEVNMGGTSGALYCIFLTAFSSTLATSSSVPEALDGALATLLKYTRARLGDRTMLDCLIPFVEVLTQSGGDVVKALAEAGRGVDGTKVMEAKLGRSTYLDESATRGTPDPGAYGLLVLLKGMCGV